MLHSTWCVQRDSGLPSVTVQRVNARGLSCGCCPPASLSLVLNRSLGLDLCCQLICRLLVLALWRQQGRLQWSSSSQRLAPAPALAVCRQAAATLQPLPSLPAHSAQAPSAHTSGAQPGSPIFRPTIGVLLVAHHPPRPIPVCPPLLHPPLAQSRARQSAPSSSPPPRDTPSGTLLPALQAWVGRGWSARECGWIERTERICECRPLPMAWRCMLGGRNARGRCLSSCQVH